MRLCELHTLITMMCTQLPPPSPTPQPTETQTKPPPHTILYKTNCLHFYSQCLVQLYSFPARTLSAGDNNYCCKVARICGRA